MSKIYKFTLIKENLLFPPSAFVGISIPFLIYFAVIKDMLVGRQAWLLFATLILLEIGYYIYHRETLEVHEDGHDTKLVFNLKSGQTSIPFPYEMEYWWGYNFPQFDTLANFVSVHQPPFVFYGEKRGSGSYANSIILNAILKNEDGKSLLLVENLSFIGEVPKKGWGYRPQTLLKVEGVYGVKRLKKLMEVLEKVRESHNMETIALIPHQDMTIEE